MSSASLQEDMAASTATVGRRRVVARALDLLGSSAVAGVYGGLIVFLVEATDRILTLWNSFNSSSETALYVLYLAPVVFLGLGAGLGTGIVFSAVGWIVRRAARGLESKLGQWSTVAAYVALALVASLLAAVALQAVATRFGDRTIRRIATTMSLYLMDADASTLSDLALALSGLVVPILIVLVFFATFALASVPAAIEPAHRTERTFGRLWRVIGAAAVLVLIYTFDSRYEYGRYDAILHVPAAILQCVLGFSMAAFALRSIGRRVTFGGAERWALVVLGFALVASTFAFVHIGANENVKALLWRRSVVARRAYSLATRVLDRDGDGYASWLAGGDPDDRNPLVHPLANEIPGNGVDDNGIAGDRALDKSEPHEVGSKPPARGKHFILIAIDTLRADRMSLYGYGRPTTPRIDAHARSGLVFDACFSQGTNTAVAFSAMQTSASRGDVFDPDRERLFVRLKSAGFHTGMVNAVEEGIWLRAKSTSGPYRRVILDGIKNFPHEFGEEFWDGDRVTDAAIEYLSSLPSGEPSATWVHYFDPHTPRRKMAPFDFGDSASDKYDSEVAYSDREVGRLLDWIASSPLGKDAIVVLTADHGEAFLEHGMDFHGNRPYGEQIHIPLVIWAPGLDSGRTLSPANIFDVGPTVIEFLGLEPMRRAEGVSLLRPTSRSRPIFSETPLNIVDGPFFAFAVTHDGWRLIHDVVGNTTELYDLANDPRELHNLADREPERRDALRTTLGHWLDTTRAVATARDAHEILGDD
jgi:arylsulfatase A-like enzyme